MRDQSDWSQSRRATHVDSEPAADEAMPAAATRSRRKTQPPPSSRARKLSDLASAATTQVSPGMRRPDAAPLSRESVAPASRQSPAPRHSEGPPASRRAKARTSKAPKAGTRPSLKPKAPRSTKKKQTTDIDERFFAEGDTASLPVVAFPTDERDDLALPVGSMVPPERRRALLKRVGTVVGVCAVLCLAAVGRRSFGNDSSLARDHRAQVVAAAAAPPAAEPVAAPVVPAIPAPPPVAAVAEVVPAAPTKSGNEEKEDARRSLERGRVQDAIDSAGRSTALDPTDADAWLLLGAAYMEKGKASDARTAFTSCAKEATKGPLRECQSMLR